MKPRLLELLACPDCRGDFALDARERDGGEILEGALECRECRRRAPIVRGVPRFVSDEAYAASFGFEWTRWSRLQVDAYSGRTDSERAFTAKTGLDAAAVRGRLVLDAGVGAGRYADVVSRWGGEVVGIDLTRAVDATWANLGRRPGVHLLQADLFDLPLAHGAFDVAYSIGVLHHTPDPGRAFGHVSATVRKGGVMAVYVYAAYGVERYASDAWRRVTTRLPARVVYWLSAAAVPLYWLYRAPVAGRLLRTLAPISMHPEPRWRWLDTFDWYSPRYQFKFRYPDVYRWFEAAGYGGVHLADEAICMRATKEG